MNIGIIGIGSFLPDNRVTNIDLEKRMDTSDEWIRTRTGIEARHLAEGDVTVADMATRAAERALQSAGVSIDEIEAIVCATATAPAFPATACVVQANLGAKAAVAFDVSAACSGFIFAMDTAKSLMDSKGLKKTLVIGAEKMGSLIDWDDRSTAVLFGDGAGAVVLGEDEIASIDSLVLGSDGTGGKHLYENEEGKIVMNGREVFKFAVRKMPEIVLEALDKADKTLEDLDVLVPHQANRRIIDAAMERLHLEEEKVVMTIQDHANTSAASIPLALAEAVKSGKIQDGQTVVIAGFGAGLTWGASCLTWNHATITEGNHL
ncbi:MULTISPECIES: beta-ketoacyl-ACP synthase III [Exiguobacterium]|jgi:3-oxoacyl-[acyl-carrier-protein] synthase-3|uniref:Beta-ketoacyl-[acyl-carrier-protein] synthase III n=1 Tax=Exiguobacterium sp. (strain ATCC BAA-1283 / AT1b) TaxID=360911 RepID=C4L560_EXISA|nr:MULTISPECIES: beta-ketoacyl-ACP synthase III [unclassified Exiguobacterium]ACQ71645.1 3-oxoacyl-(acyl-carrier-protein) synthase III [Exiguobacterium sp. AT1b]